MTGQTGSSGILELIAALMNPDSVIRNQAWQTWLASDEGKDLERAVCALARQYTLDEGDLYLDTVGELYCNLVLGNFDPARARKPERASLAAYAKGIARNLARQYARERSRADRLPVEEPNEDAEDEGGSVQQISSQKTHVETLVEAHDSLKKALAGLKPLARSVFVLTEILGMTGKEAAKELGISHENLRVLRLRAKRHVAQHLA
jgi:RNA polymerase sigma factor (sigma-70 family)